MIVFLRILRRLPVTTNVGLSSPILVTLMMEALSSSQMSVLTRFLQGSHPYRHLLADCLDDVRSSTSQQR
jgi:hypothetical protein